MSVRIEVSCGELIDKITILRIKQARFEDAAKRANVARELALLEAHWHEASHEGPDVAPEIAALQDVNEALWDIEDRLRIKEAARDFDAEFIELARQVYITNDRRAALKRTINDRLGSDLVEEKQYVPY